MGKALMVCVPGTVLASGNEYNLFGSGNPSSTEANSQISCTEDAVFSGLGANITAGNSGTATFQFRDAGANGQQVASRASTGACEDTTNTDTLTAGDLFNIAYTDTGTDSTLSWSRMNVAFSSGHGNFHGSTSPVALVFDVGSATRYISPSGRLAADGTATIANAQWKVRGYSSIEALQIRVAANARVNDTVFSVNVNGSDTGTAVTITSTDGAGLYQATGLGISLSDGDLVCISCTMGAGVEDLTLTAVVTTFKSSTNESESFWGIFDSTGQVRAASATADYYPIGGRAATDTEANIRIKPGFAGIATNLRSYLSANTYGGAATLKLMQNGSAVITTTIGAGGGAAWYENTSDTVSFDDNDEFSFEIDEGTSGSITIRSIGITFAPASGGIAPRAFNHLHKLSNA